MVEYTLGQVIDKLGRNPKLKFQFVAEETYKSVRGIVIALDGDGRVVNQEGQPVLSDFTLRSRFRLVNAPVDRMAAFRAFHEGKTIYCDCRGIRYYYKPESSGKLTIFENQFYKPVSIEEILYGKWFIGEGKDV
ncbi:hypothetical protein LN736_16935 [Clostridium sp. WLY-B-L2]|uniref:Uncharacterized protein n=1 Tax=Clostridium aromativorans TaxID=2836848 RepID=A0ABS8N9Q0_9CLOT|nr:hypothetical protein [Clostridium aromativorans]MCC9296532.1 hypothetical protein [Clostridium aromativorans]